jgi:hypothetical protein
MYNRRLDSFLSFYVCYCTFTSTCISAHILIHIFVFLSVCQSIFSYLLLSVYIPFAAARSCMFVPVLLHPSACLIAFASVIILLDPSVCLSACLCVCPYLTASLYLPVCLSCYQLLYLHMLLFACVCPYTSKFVHPFVYIHVPTSNCPYLPVSLNTINLNLS